MFSLVSHEIRYIQEDKITHYEVFYIFNSIYGNYWKRSIWVKWIEIYPVNPDRFEDEEFALTQNLEPLVIDDKET